MEARNQPFFGDGSGMPVQARTCKGIVAQPFPGKAHRDGARTRSRGRLRYVPPGVRKNVRLGAFSFHIADIGAIVTNALFRATQNCGNVIVT